jgi:hypothetical protein
MDRWYRHAAICIWPERIHFDVLCESGDQSAAAYLELMVGQWKRSGKKDAQARKAECVAFASRIIANWNERSSRGWDEQERVDPLLRSLAVLGEPDLIRAYLGNVLSRDVLVEPGKSLTGVCEKHGWGTFGQELEGFFKSTTEQSLERNIRLLEQICLAKPRKKAGWSELCEALARAAILALETIDEGAPPGHYWSSGADRAKVLAGLVRSLLGTGQDELLGRVVDHALARPQKYPLTAVHVAALTALAPWLPKNVARPSPALSRWIASCREQLETLTAQMPQPPSDWRRASALSCKCAECRELSRFLDDPQEQTHRFPVAESHRQHLQGIIQQDRCDVSCKTERKGRPYTLICTKTEASYHERLKTFHRDQKDLATLRAIQASLP